MRHVISLIALLGASESIHAGLIFKLIPNSYTAASGEVVETFATVTNTGPGVLFYAFSFVNVGTVPATGVTGQTPPLVLQPSDSINFAGATITTDGHAKTGTYAFVEGAGYHPGPGVTDFIEASDVGTLLIVPEPASLVLCCSGVFVVMAFRALCWGRGSRSRVWRAARRVE